GSLATSTTVVVRPTCGCLLNLPSGTAFGTRLDSTDPRSRGAVPVGRWGTGGTHERRRCVGPGEKVAEHARRRLCARRSGPAPAGSRRTGGAHPCPGSPP